MSSVSANLSKHMPAVQDYRQRLATLQGAWDTLSLLSHLSGDGTDMGGTRHAFETLTAELIRNLAVETHRKTVLALKARAQIAIDIMVRNLFERTADIGFLATDEHIRHYLASRSKLAASESAEQLQGLDESLRKRFREYVAKYSVYHDVILAAPDGQLLLRLDANAALIRSQDPLFAAALTTREGYIETFRHSDLLPEETRSLIYSCRVTGDGGRILGVLCLCFRFEDEVRRIFAKLQESSDWTLFALLDAHGEVIASSDRWQLPPGAPLALGLHEDGDLVRFAGREYLSITRSTLGYQGYRGPGWYGQALIPVEHAFERRPLQMDAKLSQHVLSQLRDSSAIFSDELRRIPRQADAIQRELNRAVWNSNVRLGQHSGQNDNFAKVMLWEIGNAGRRTQDTFDQSILDLQETVISAIFDDAELLAALAVDVLDRNLYERANDCRWWALDRTFAQTLANEAAHDRAFAVLRRINGLYTVYHDIVMFDAHRRVVANSNTGAAGLVGSVVDEPWAAQTLALRGSHEFSISAFAPAAAYADQRTLIFGAAIRSGNGKTLGGIGVVFDAAPQLAAMLREALPRTESGEPADGCIGLFIDQNMQVIAATSQYQPGETLPLARDFLRKTGSADQLTSRIVTLHETSYAIGVRATAGYREYRGLSAFAVILIPLGPATTNAVAAPRATRSNAQHHGPRRQDTLDIATFRCVDQRLGVLREEVVEAVDGTGLRSVPGSPFWHAGLLMYRDSPVPIIDLARLLGKSPDATVGDVIIARSPGTKDFVGLLIHELGDIPEVSPDRVLPFAERAQHGGAQIIDRAVRPESADGPVLFIINLGQLLLHTRTATT